MKAVVIARLSDNKLKMKLAGLVRHPNLSEVVLIRRQSLQLEKVTTITPPVLINRSTVLFEVWRCLTLLRVLMSQRIDVVVGIQAYMHGIVAVCVARMFGIKSILWLIGSDLNVHARRRFWGAPCRWAAKRASAVIVMGERGRRDLTALIGRRSNIYENQVAVGESPPVCRALEKKAWDLIFIGNLVEVKRPDRALVLLQLMKERGFSLRLAVLGTGNLSPYLIGLTERLGLAGQVDFLGYVSDPAVYLRQSRVHVMTSASEGLPSVLIEAASCGVPSIAPDVGEIPYVFGASPSVHLCGGHDLQGYANAVERLLGCRESYNRASASAVDFFRVFEKMWSVDGQARQWRMILAESGVSVTAQKE